MSKQGEVKQMLRKQSGIDHNNERITLRRWISWLKNHKDASISNLGYGLAFGVKTGRIVNFESADDGRFLTRNYKRMTNLQVVTMLAKAAIAQNGQTDTAAAVKALQDTMGIKVR